MPLKCPQFSSLSGYFFQLIAFFFFFNSHHDLCPNLSCPILWLLRGYEWSSLLLRHRQTMECGKWLQGRGLACHTRVLQKHFCLAACWSLTVAVPAALPPPHGPCVSSPAQPARSLFSPLPRRSPFIFMFFLHVGDVHGLQYVSQKPLWI